MHLRKHLHRLFTGLFVAGFLGVAWMISAEPARERILERVDVHSLEGGTRLEIGLSYPFRYLSHFPQDSGCELRIQVRPVRVSSADAGAVGQREALRPPGAAQAAIDEVVYEGDAIEGPRVTVHFTAPVSYRVIPGNDYRHITVEILDTASTQDISTP